MKNKKYLKTLIVFISLSILIIFSFVLDFSPPVKEGVREGLEVQIEPKALSEKNIMVSLVVQEKKYETKIKEGATVFEVMQKIKNENNKDNLFDFKYEEFTGLGIFIDEINGLKGGNSGYWIYSVNGVEANVGVSNYKIKDGDVISWKYEK